MASADAPDGAVAAIAAGVRSGERIAAARALNLVEDRRPEARPAIAALLLGDRARIDTEPGDQGMFVRSLATAGELVEWGVRDLLRRVGEEGGAREGGLAAARARIEARVRQGAGPL